MTIEHLGLMRLTEARNKNPFSGSCNTKIYLLNSEMGKIRDTLLLTLANRSGYIMHYKDGNISKKKIMYFFLLNPLNHRKYTRLL